MSGPRHEEDVQFHAELDASRTCLKKMESSYDKWAEKYDEILECSSAYESNQYAAQKLLKYIKDKENAILLEVPCGTGMTGEVVQKAGFCNIDGTDLSNAMLEEAKRKGIYRKVFKSCVTDTSKMVCPANTYDGAYSVKGISVGMLELAPTVNEMLRVTKPNGILVYTVNLNVGVEEFMKVHSKLMTDLKVELIRIEKRFYYRKKRRGPAMLLLCFEEVVIIIIKLLKNLRNYIYEKTI